MKYQTKDSGERVKFDSGFQRDVTTGKPRYDLIPHEMLTRLAELMARGADLKIIRFSDELLNEYQR